MCARRASTLRRLRLAAAMAPLMLAVAGCATTQSEQFGAPEAEIETGAVQTIDPAFDVAPEQRAETADQNVEAIALSAFSREAAELAMSQDQPYGALIHLSKVYDAAPRDRKVIYNYARHLRYVGATTQAQQILNNGLNLYPTDPLLRLERAKALIAAGTAQAALPELEKLRAEHPSDPAILQTAGIALDRLGRHSEAQEAYAIAMRKGRASAKLLNNAGLSYLISGDLERAEQLLREAVVAHGADVQVRQNLAMALAIKGDIEEATAYAQEALPKATARELIAYYQSIVRQQDAWSIAAEES